MQQQAAVAFVGRDEELARLRALVEADSPTFVVFLHGMAGIGKSALLTRFADEARSHGAKVTILDCRVIEPTEQGFLEAVGESLELTEASIEAVTEAVAAMSGRIVIALDNFEVFRLLDTWLRLALVPRLPASVRLILCGRQAPTPGWMTDTEVHGAVGSLQLGPLRQSDARALMRQLGLPESKVAVVDRVARGHPLSIRLTAAALSERPEVAVEALATGAVVDQLIRVFLADVDDPLTKIALQAAAVVRRTTRPLLTAMLGEATATATAFEQLRDLPFVDARRDGLVIHDAVQEALATDMRASDPVRYRHLRRLAWRELRAEVREVGRPELWRYTADMLYLIENPVVREAFFPSGSNQSVGVEPAGPADDPAIDAITEAADGGETLRLMRGWRSRRPAAFSVVRDEAGAVAGFFCLLDSATVHSAYGSDDLVVASWARHLHENPVPYGQSVLGLRRWLDRDLGEMPCPSQAASWLDVKRSYMELRPGLRRIYTVVHDVPTYWPVVEKLGFRPLDAVPAGRRGRQTAAFEPVLVDGRPYTSVVLDFGPASVDGWLAGLVAAELGVDEPYVVDAGGRVVRVDGRDIELTPLEFGLFTSLQRHEGRAVSRVQLLEEVWGTDFDGGSNVVDVVAASLRRKLGPKRSVIETVRGTGYRLADQ